MTLDLASLGARHLIHTDRLTVHFRRTVGFTLVQKRELVAALRSRRHVHTVYWEKESADYDRYRLSLSFDRTASVEDQRALAAEFEPSYRVTGSMGVIIHRDTAGKHLLTTGCFTLANGPASLPLRLDPVRRLGFVDHVEVQDGPTETVLSFGFVRATRDPDRLRKQMHQVGQRGRIRIANFRDPADFIQDPGPYRLSSVHDSDHDRS